MHTFFFSRPTDIHLDGMHTRQCAHAITPLPLSSPIIRSLCLKLSENLPFIAHSHNKQSGYRECRGIAAEQQCSLACVGLCCGAFCCNGAIARYVHLKETGRRQLFLLRFRSKLFVTLKSNSPFIKAFVFFFVFFLQALCRPVYAALAWKWIRRRFVVVNLLHSSARTSWTAPRYIR